MAHQGSNHSQSSRPWDRLVNPVQDLGRTLLNFLVGGNPSNVQSEQNALSVRSNSNASGGQNNASSGHAKDKPGSLSNSLPSSNNITQATPVILRRNQPSSKIVVSSSNNENCRQDMSISNMALPSRFSKFSI